MAREQRDFIFHNALADMGPTRITVDSKPRFLKGKGKWVVDITLVNQNEVACYWCPNEGCKDTLAQRIQAGPFTVVAAGGGKGKDDTATLTYVGEAAMPATAHQPTTTHAAPAPHSPPATKKHYPLGVTVGMAINCACANLTARGYELATKDVATIASDLLRLSRWLEEGNLIASKKAPPTGTGTAHQQPAALKCPTHQTPLRPDGGCQACMDEEAAREAATGPAEHDDVPF